MGVREPGSRTPAERRGWDGGIKNVKWMGSEGGINPIQLAFSSTVESFSGKKRSGGKLDPTTTKSKRSDGMGIQMVRKDGGTDGEEAVRQTQRLRQ